MDNQTPTTGPILGPTSFSFKGINWKKLGITVLAVAVGAVFTYLTSLVSGWNFGPLLTPIITTGWTALAVIVQKWVSDNE